MIDWIVGYLELLKAVLIIGFFMTLGFFIVVFIFDLILVLISTIYELIRGKK